MSEKRSQELIDQLNMQPHPEGGHYAEVFRSPQRVKPADGRPDRPALTAIFFLLRSGEFSCFHQVRSDETWHFHEGDPLEVVLVDPEIQSAEQHLLGQKADNCHPLIAIPAHTWQAARPIGDYALVSCCVGPGFVFEDFAMMKDIPEVARQVREKWPQWQGLVG